MAWAEPQYTKEQVNGAGRAYVAIISGKDAKFWQQPDWDEYDRTVAVINNWRACHGYPLNTFQVNLRSAAARYDDAPLVAQRTKRLFSIGLKLNRFSDMKLTQMQDIGGCRSVVKSAAAVRSLDHFYRRVSSIKHELASRDDYISQPQRSGYRGIHLVYRYFSDKAPKAIYNGLKIEMQLRSQYQHAWATAVETVGAFVGQALKSSLGAENWLRFFSLMGTAIAMRERTSPVPATPTLRKELVEELDHYAYLLNVENRLKAYGDALQRFEQRAEHAHYYLMKLDPDANQLVITGFQRDQIEEAQRAYAEAERATRDMPGTDAVLVSVDSLAALQRAYPNYFADTRIFVALLQQALSGHQRRIFMGPLTLRSK